MSVEEDVVKAKENLQNALGERFNDYMQSMRKWFSGKSTKQEFDREAREIVTERYVHLHNEFLLCIITKCNNFSSSATEVASTTIFPLMSTSLAPKTPPSASNVTTSGNKRKLTPTPPPNSSATAQTKYNLRFVPVDPIKYAPTIQTASLHSATMASRGEEFGLEFCARERTLPYARMIHSRMLLSALDYNLSPHVDMQAVFLLAEATLAFLKNIISKLSTRSRMKQALLRRALYEEHVRQTEIKNERILEGHAKRMENPEQKFEIEEKFIKSLKRNHNAFGLMEVDDDDDEQAKMSEPKDDMDVERKELEGLLDQYNYAMTIPAKKLPSNLFDLKTLLQCNKKLIPSHSIRTVTLEKIICNMWHDDDNQVDNSVEN